MIISWLTRKGLQICRVFGYHFVNFREQESLLWVHKSVKKSILRGCIVLEKKFRRKCMASHIFNSFQRITIALIEIEIHIASYHHTKIGNNFKLPSFKVIYILCTRSPTSLFKKFPFQKRMGFNFYVLKSFF